MASGNHIAIANTTTFFPGGDLGAFDALDTVSAFFHHATTANGDFWIQHQGLKLAVCGFNIAWKSVDAVTRSDFFIEIEVVEPTNFEGTVIGTVTSSNATVVGHRIDAFVRVHGCRNWANLFTRCRFAVHAGNRLLNDIRVLFGSLEVTVDTQPMHLAALDHLLATDNRNIVFALASNHAGIASSALGQVDRHAPLRNVAVVWIFFDHVHRFFPRRTVWPDLRHMRFLGCARGELRNFI